MKIHYYKDFVVQETSFYKGLRSAQANYDFNKLNGNMLTWGEDKEHEAIQFPAPTILDLEVTTSCNGVGGRLCPFCYKANNPNGVNMDYETFKNLLDKLPKTITQIAFGADSQCKTNPDIFNMMIYARDQGFIPNITVAELDQDTAVKLASVCGAVAVSRYHDKDIFANSVKYLTDAGLDQVNAHMMISNETYDRAIELINDVATDPRLEKLNAIVFLSLKTKGRGEHYNILSQERFNELVNLCKEKGINYGFDSCSSIKFFKSLDDKEYKELKDYIQPCESTLESSYIDVHGNFFPCSFTEGTEGWGEGISVLDCENFIEDVWNNPRVQFFRERLLATTKCNIFGCRECPLYTI